MTSNRIRVAVADDEQLVRTGVRAILESSPRIEVVAETANGREAVELVTTRRIDVLLLDIEMPVLDGIAATDEIRRAGHDARILILTTFGTDENLRRCLTAGADGFLIKASAPAELITGGEATAAGGAVIAPRVATYLVDSFRSAPPAADASELAGLSPRELEVLRLLSHGLSNAEIAAQLYLTEGTVKGYVSAVLLALGVSNRVQAALIGYRARLAGDDGNRDVVRRDETEPNYPGTITAPRRST